MFSQILGDDSIRNPNQAVDPMKLLATFATSLYPPRQLFLRGMARFSARRDS